jgi:uncharacterized protein YndB with AHSA1/START domain
MPAALHQYEIYIRAPREEVWAALLDPELTRAYFHGTAFERPPVLGASYRTSMPDGTPSVEGTVEVLDPPRRLVLTWHPLYDAAMAAEPASRVEWQLEDAGEGLTRLRLVHGDLARSPRTWAGVEHGWVWILDGLKTVLETGAPLPPPTTVPSPASDPDGEWHRHQAVAANNSTWELIERPDRDEEADEDMLRRAYAAAFHWDRAAGRTPANTARADWLLARVHLLVGRPETSLHHATRCLAACEAHGLVDFDLAYAHEAAARALKALGRDEEAARHWAAAKAVPVRDPEDRELVAADLAEGP